MFGPGSAGVTSNSTSCRELAVLYQDNEFVAVAKPAGMFVHRTEMDRRVRTVVVQTVRDQLRRPVYLVNRLDRPASGIVLLGLTSEAAAAAAEIFRERRVSKSYVVLVRGHAPDAGRIERPLTSPEVKTTEALESVTEYRTTERLEVPMASGKFPTTRCSLVNVTPRTGRFHQIRRHLNGISHPVIGDTSHGDSRQNRFFRENLGVDRLMLHASQLMFQHPVTGERLEINCPLPQDFSDPLQRVRLMCHLEAGSGDRIGGDPGRI